MIKLFSVDNSDLDYFNLSVARICFYGWVALKLVYWNYFNEWRDVPSAFFVPQGLAAIVNFIRPFIPWSTVFFLWTYSVIFSSLGIFSWLSRWMAFVTGTLLIAQAQSYGYFGHSFMPIWWGLLFFTLTNHCDQFSLDQIIFKKNVFYKKISSIHFLDGVQVLFLLRIILCVVFFNAGVSKLVNSGFFWGGSNNIENFILRAWVWHRDLTSLGAKEFTSFLLGHSFLFAPLSSLALMLEIFSPVAILPFARRWLFIRYGLILGLWLMQKVIKYTLLVSFDSYLCLYLCWIPWSKIYYGLRKIYAAKVLY